MAIVYKDLEIKLAGSVVMAHFIDSLGRTDSFFQRLATRQYYISLFFGFLITLALWELVRRITLYLDPRYPWLPRLTQRMLLQLLLGVALPAIVCFFLMMAFLQAVWQQDIFKTEWLHNEFSVAVVLLLGINTFYFTWWLYHHATLPVATRTEIPQPEEPITETEPPKKQTYLEAQKGGKTVLIPHDSLAYAFLQDGYCYLKTTTPETFVTTYALDDLFGLLDEADFFRANRQMIIQRTACKSYSSLEHGKILVELEPPAKEPVVVSQKRARAFRDWIGRA
jgi:hypothetical protein